MKIQLQIDQKASLIAGLEAPDSTMILEISAAEIPSEIREIVMPFYDLPSGKFSGFPSFDRQACGWPNLPDAEMPRILANCDAAGAISAVCTYAEQLRARAAALVIAREAYSIASAEKDALAVIAKAAADDAKAADRAGIATGIIPVVAASASNGSCSSAKFYHAGGDDIAPVVTTYLAEIAAKSEARVEAKKARDLATYAARLESGEWSRECGSYNERRYGAYWCARLDFSGCTTKADPQYSWGESDATHGRAGTISTPCAPGDFIAWGQKDLRKPKDTEHHFLRMRADGSMEEYSGAAECYRVVKAERKGAMA